MTYLEQVLQVKLSGLLYRAHKISHDCNTAIVDCDV
jgi:hypothetical protein